MQIEFKGLVPYVPTFEAMQAYTAARTQAGEPAAAVQAFPSLPEAADGCVTQGDALAPAKVENLSQTGHAPA